MAGTFLSALSQPRRRPLATCVASLFALSAPAAAIADTWTVNSCDEGSFSTGVNSGTLRYALQHATSPATINLTGLTGLNACLNSKISLTTGELDTTITTLTITGPGAETLQIDASGLPPSYGDSRVIAHTGAGTLTIQNLGITGGHVYHSTHPSQGGCIFSTGDVELDGTNVSSCYVTEKDTEYFAAGGAIFTPASITLNSSSVTSSSARALVSTKALGGGIYAGSTVTVNDYSSIGQNYAKSVSGKALGGSVYSKGNVTITKSSIYVSQASSSTAYAVGGGLYALGNLTISGAAIIQNSTYSGTARAIGGGLYVKGNASVAHCFMKYNTATSIAARAYGGGAYIHGNFTLTSSQLYKNAVSSSSFFSIARGGGAAAGGNFFTSYSAIRDNAANGPGVGAGLDLKGNVITIASSTISGNTSAQFAGGVRVYTNASASATFQIKNSTISGNSALGVGGLYVDSGTAKFYNTTIAFNTSTGAASSPGVRLKAPSPSMDVTLESTLLSNNTYGTSEDDLDTTGANPVVFNGGDLATPANNLVRVTPISPALLPGDTKQGSCPYLGKLRNNGGVTETHALLSHSIAIDNGNTNLGGLPYDQRGSSIENGTIDYLRVSGPSANPSPKPDIGAYEVQQNDVVFNTDFENC